MIVGYKITRCQKRHYEQDYDIFHQNIRLSGNSESSKIRLLQSYEVLWIHLCEPNCSYSNKDPNCMAL